MDGEKICEKKIGDLLVIFMNKKELLWELLREIPRGKVTTYKILAERLSAHPRAVGRMLNSNPRLVVVPCHRVVCSCGKLGGYKLGVGRKTELLEKEGVAVVSGRVDLSCFLFRL